MTRIAIITGTTRPGRKSLEVAEWVLDRAKQRGDAEFEIVDLAEHDLPLYDEPIPPSLGRYVHEHTKRWAEVIDGFDGYIFVTGEYNHSIPAVLKNAVDFVYGEWNNKAAGFVSYGSASGSRAVEQLRLVMAELQVATVRAQVLLSLATDFENYTVFTPDERHLASLDTLLDQLVSWSGALESVRAA